MDLEKEIIEIIEFYQEEGIVNPDITRKLHQKKIKCTKKDVNQTLEKLRKEGKITFDEVEIHDSKYKSWKVYNEEFLSQKVKYELK
jgi:hypothetical protein